LPKRSRKRITALSAVFLHLFHRFFFPSGGSVTAGLAIYDTMQLIQCPVATWCVGQASSMASLLLSAGAPGMRNALPNSRIMLHQPLGGAQVNLQCG